MIVNILQNESNRYFSHNSNIKCIGSTIKCVRSEPIHYAINIYVVSLSMVFNDFNSTFIMIIL